MPRKVFSFNMFILLDSLSWDLPFFLQQVGMFLYVDAGSHYLLCQDLREIVLDFW